MSNALIDAARKNDVPLVVQLIVRGVDLNGVDDEWGRTALCWAAEKGVVQCAKVLLEANADVDKGDVGGWTPLHSASTRGYVECAKLLIDWKANVNAKTKDGHSILHKTAHYGHLACIEMLIQAGAEVDARNNDGKTPLALVIYFGKSPLPLEILNDRHDAAELLLDKGAKMSNVHEDVHITDWMEAIVTKRQNVRRSLTTFAGVLRKRFAVVGGGTEYTRGRLPRDVVGVISRWAWSTRFDKRWEGAVPEKLKL